MVQNVLPFKYAEEKTTSQLNANRAIRLFQISEPFGTLCASFY